MYCRIFKGFHPASIREELSRHVTEKDSQVQRFIWTVSGILIELSVGSCHRWDGQKLRRMTSSSNASKGSLENRYGNFIHTLP